MCENEQILWKMGRCQLWTQIRIRLRENESDATRTGNESTLFKRMARVRRRMLFIRGKGTNDSYYVSHTTMIHILEHFRMTVEIGQVLQVTVKQKAVI